MRKSVTLRPANDDDRPMTAAERDRRRRREGLLFGVLFCLTVPAANWMVAHLGTTCIPHGPCLVPLGFGLEAPSGVLMIGLALVLRDLTQRRLGVAASMLAIAVGAAISAALAPAALVLASTAAFLASEFADLAVYTPLRRRGLVLPVVASGAAGLVVDSVLFLWLAFGSLDFLAGQVAGKAVMIVAAIPFVMLLRRRDERLGLATF